MPRRPVLYTGLMILEVAHLDVKQGLESQFESAFKEASAIISGASGYRGHELQRCIESGNRYVLLVRWNRLEDHSVGFRQSVAYQRWKSLLHHFYDPFPVVEHYEPVAVDDDEAHAGTANCPFCVLAAGADRPEIESKQSDTFYRDEEILAFISAGWWPNNPGSVLVIPRRHYDNIYDVSESAYAAINAFGRRLAHVMKQEYACDGVSFRQHNEKAGGQSVNHFHLWVFPRYEGDRLYELYAQGAVVPVELRRQYAKRLEKHFL